MQTIIKAIAAVLLLVFGCQVSAKVYKCKTPEGEIIYSQFMCEGEADNQNVSIKKESQSSIQAREKNVLLSNIRIKKTAIQCIEKTFSRA